MRTPLEKFRGWVGHISDPDPMRGDVVPEIYNPSFRGKDPFGLFRPENEGNDLVADSAANESENEPEVKRMQRDRRFRERLQSRKRK